MRGDKERIKREYGGKLIIEDDRTPGRNRPPKYRQDHLPVVDQREATGHAVRAGYLYTAMADIALECDSKEHALAATANDPEDVTLSPDTPITAEHDPDLLSGITVLTNDSGSIKAIPFCVWNNRDPGKMLVWIKERN